MYDKGNIPLERHMTPDGAKTNKLSEKALLYVS